jgi:hypothetical protein
MVKYQRESTDRRPRNAWGSAHAYHQLYSLKTVWLIKKSRGKPSKSGRRYFCKTLIDRGPPRKYSPSMSSLALSCRTSAAGWLMIDVKGLYIIGCALQERYTLIINLLHSAISLDQSFLHPLSHAKFSGQALRE